MQLNFTKHSQTIAWQEMSECTSMSYARPSFYDINGNGVMT